MNKQELLNKIENVKTRSAWRRGVKEYALEILENVDDETELTTSNAKKVLLNGAESWSQYSWGGCSLIYDCDIAERLCTPSGLKKTRNGERRPNAKEEWLDTQARALKQAYNLIINIL